MIQFFISAGAVVLVGLSTYAQSVPVKGASCASRKKVNPVANGNGVFFDETCQIAYVLPPEKGLMELDSIAGTMNLDQCGEVSDLSAAIRGLTTRLKYLLAQINNPGSAGGGPTGGGPSGGGPFGPPSSDTGTAPPPVPSEMQAELTQITAEIRELQTLRKAYDGIQGATAHFIYSLGMQDLVDRYQKANSGIHFEALPFSRAYLSFNKKEKGASAEASAVLSISVPGLGRLPDAPDPNHLNPQGQPVTSTEADPPDLSATRLFGSSLAGTMELSLHGACPFYNSVSKKLPSRLNGQELSAHLSANVQYAYALQALRAYRAKYNLGIFVSKILENTTKGGFLSTKTVTSYIENTRSDDWFRFESQSTDPRFYYPYLAQEIKANLIDRALRQITLAKMGGPVAGVGTIAPQPNGASSAAEGLHKCPNFYCQAGAFILDVLSATAGSTTAVNKFISNNSYWAEDDVTEKTMLEYYGSAGFVGDVE